MRNVENIPSEVMTLILLKLSVISLLRCKCVCKTWYALIKNPSFISTHLKSHNNDDSHLVVRNCNYNCDPGYPFLYAVFIDKTLKDLSYQVLDSQLPIPGELFGPYDGLFLLYQKEYNRIYLLNIATRETRALPQCRFVVPNMTLATRFYFGCGYDPLSDDYKLVFLRQFSDENGYDDVLDSHVSLYSFNNDSWRDLQVAELRRYFWVEYSSQNSYLNGVCHWLALREMGSKYVILSFDISSEIFQEIDLPTHPLNGGCSMLEVVNDSLYLLTGSYNPEFEFSIWMMRDGCWTIRLTSTHDYENGPMRYWKNDTIFMSHGLGAEHLLLLDLNSKEEIDLGIPWVARDDVFRYNESLVSIKRENDFSEVFDIPWHVFGVI
ncbi:hypothetical protein LWI29_024501 [Acer saccharum]|uniref:F-box domain-containing protein n=1 Tax=Acer saccharum TaxID=4024 RepID=A0AA39VWM1_ACESA|nr:hypothetical protein LWI29_024501 [Acer saccharum]